MVYLGTCSLVFVLITIIQPRESLASEEILFKKSEQQYLSNHVMETKKTESELICGLYCAAEKSCTSINYKTSGSDKGQCELNDKTVEASSDIDDKIHHAKYNHLAVIQRVSVQLLYALFFGIAHIAVGLC